MSGRNACREGNSNGLQWRATLVTACGIARAHRVLCPRLLFNGRAAIANHDLPERARRNPDFEMPPLPLTRDHLAAEGVSPAFIEYLGGSFQGFVAA